MMFVNFTNHPSDKWNGEQLKAAGKYGEIHDMPFPSVDPEAKEGEIMQLAFKYADEIINMKPDAVLCQGEFSLHFLVTQLLLQAGITVLSACSRRETRETVLEDGKTTKVTVFNFCGFRRFELI